MNLSKDIYYRQNCLQRECFQILQVFREYLLPESSKKKVKRICFPFISLLFIPEETLYHLDVKNPKGLHRNNGM